MSRNKRSFKNQVLLNVLLNPGTNDAHGLLVVSGWLGRELLLYGYEGQPAPAKFGYRLARMAPRWLVTYVSLFGVDIPNARTVVARGLADPDWASAFYVVMTTGGAEAARVFACETLGE